MSLLGTRTMQLTKHTGSKHTATVIFFHGSGGTGADIKEWVNVVAKNFTFPHIKVLYPSAPSQPYTPAGGLHSNVWFDRASVSIKAPEMLDSISKIEVEVRKLIKSENEAGIPNDRIIVGGFSMGGALAMYTGFRWYKDLAGVFALSSFLNEQSIVYEGLKEIKTPVPLLSIHGDQDELVDIEWAHTTLNNLRALGVQGEFYVRKGMGHMLDREELAIVKQWIEKRLPEV